MSEYYKADATSRLQIRAVAKEIRNLFGLQNRFEFPIVEVFETLSVCGEFNFEILTRAVMGNKYGETFPGKNQISLREDIYDKATAGDPFSRSTIAHELYHWLCHSDQTISLCRTDADVEARKPYEDPEWQANCFAGELLVPKDLVAGMSVEEVMQKCNVSRAMANYQLRQYRREG